MPGGDTKARPDSAGRAPRPPPPCSTAAPAAARAAWRLASVETRGHSEKPHPRFRQKRTTGAGTQPGANAAAAERDRRPAPGRAAATSARSAARRRAAPPSPDRAANAPVVRRNRPPPNPPAGRARRNPSADAPAEAAPRWIPSQPPSRARPDGVRCDGTRQNGTGERRPAMSRRGPAQPERQTDARCGALGYRSGARGAARSGPRARSAPPRAGIALDDRGEGVGRGESGCGDHGATYTRYTRTWQPIMSASRVGAPRRGLRPPAPAGAASGPPRVSPPRPGDRSRRQSPSRPRRLHHSPARRRCG